MNKGYETTLLASSRFVLKMPLLAIWTTYRPPMHGFTQRSLFGDAGLKLLRLYSDADGESHWEDVEVGLQEAGQVIFLMLMVAVAGRIAFGKLADVIGPLLSYMVATAWMTVMVYGFMYMETLSEFSIYAVIYGFGYAGVMTGILVSVATLTHPSHRASAIDKPL